MAALPLAMSEPDDNHPSTAIAQDAAKQGGIDADVARGIREAAAAFRGYPFGELAAPDANLADVKAFFADYSARAEALRSALATSKDPRAADALSFLAQLDKVATFLSSNVLAGEPSQPLTLVPACRLMPSVSTGSEQVVSWSLRTDQQESLYPGRAAASLEWNFGQAIALELIWAKKSEWRPAMPNAAIAPGLTVAHESATFSAGGTCEPVPV